MEQDNSKGFYGPDGEYYPPGSTPAFSERPTAEYPKRPEIKYTTQAFPGSASPAVRNDAVNSDAAVPESYTGNLIYCKYCGKKVPEQAVVCVHCGCQIKELASSEPKYTAPPPKVIVNNVNNNANISHNGHAKNKWVAFSLCLFGGYLGLHKFYEGKILLGLVYMFTGGLFGIGWFVDTICHLFKPNPYYI